MSMLGEGRAERGVSMLEGSVTGEGLRRLSLALGAESADTQTNILSVHHCSSRHTQHVLLP